jgi:hypothetical protein
VSLSSLLWWSGALAFLSGVFAFAFDAGFFEEFAAAKLRKDAFLLDPFVKAP